MSDNVKGKHDFHQAPDAPILICNAFVLTQLCGKWPAHHWHTGDRTSCTCDQCRKPTNGVDPHPAVAPVLGETHVDTDTICDGPADCGHPNHGETWVD